MKNEQKNNPASGIQLALSRAIPNVSAGSRLFILGEINEKTKI